MNAKWLTKLLWIPDGTNADKESEQWVLPINGGKLRIG